MNSEMETPKSTETRNIGTRVRALKQITEGGVPGDPDAKFPAPNYIHAERGDKGTIVHVEHDGALTVRFEPAGTATVVLPYEIEAITLANRYIEEIHDDNGPTGQFIDVREMRMDDEHFHADVLDDGIRETVLWLRANGFRTIDSGDGKKDHPCAYKFANVWMTADEPVATFETDRLMARLCSHNIAVNSDTGDSPSLDMTYTPGEADAVLIRLFYVDDELLRKHGVIAKTAAPLAATPPWNTCPVCQQLTALPDFEQPGTRLRCSGCGVELVAECLGADEEWRLLRASDLDGPDSEGG